MALDGLCHRNNSTVIAMKRRRKLGDDYCRSNTLASVALFIYSVELWRYQGVANMIMCPITMLMWYCTTGLFKMMVKCSTTKQKLFSIQLLASVDIPRCSYWMGSQWEGTIYANTEKSTSVLLLFQNINMAFFLKWVIDW